jgi:hypothetical protein
MTGGRKLIRMRVRFDYVAEGKTSRRLFAAKGGDEQAEELRQQKTAMIRNVPIQGINIEEIDMSKEIYSIFDEYTNRLSICAPVTITFSVDTLEDAVKFIMKDEFRTIEVLEPAQISMSGIETERLFAKMNEGLQAYRSILEKKMDNWK